MGLDRRIDEVRVQVFQKAGRNLANFQQIESLLKIVLAGGQISSSVSESKNSIARDKRHVKAPTFGTLVEQFPEALSGQVVDAPKDVQHPWVAISFSFDDLTPDILQQFRKEMRIVVRDRNRLVHHMFAGVGRGSLEDWEKLCAELDAQRQRTLEVYERVRLLAARIQHAHQMLMKDIDFPGLLDRILSQVPLVDE